ncbi:MAG: hypothetical protein RIR18_1768 [Pseudomonadota bacterium]
MTFLLDDESFMRRALALAQQAGERGEIPVGAVVVSDGAIIGEGWNAPIGSHDPTAHAEVMAIRAAAKRLGNYRLAGATLYVTLEPCVMCAGAIHSARIGRVVYGAVEPKTGAHVSRHQLFEAGLLHHKTSVEGGLLADECGEQLSRFFMARRQQQKQRRGGGMKIRISIPDQTLTVLDTASGAQLAAYSVSTAANGAGEQSGSYKTPRGFHRIRAKIGAGQLENTVFVARRPTGEIWSPELSENFPERDWILTRILWLCGCEPGRNRWGDVDTMRRYIYIHGTPDTTEVGKPGSHGCIRMRNQDLVALFDLVAAGTSVEIV